MILIISIIMVFGFMGIMVLIACKCKNLLNLQFLTNLKPRNLSLIFYHLVKLIKEFPLLNLGKQ